MTAPSSADAAVHHLATQRTARYYALGAATGAPPRELWIVLHGHGQLAGTFIRYFADLDDGTRLIVAPEALSRYYLIPVDAKPAAERPVGATWMTREDREHEIADYVAYLDALHHALVAAHGARDVPVHVVGFSQGAATASRWVESGSVAVARCVLWGGLTPPDIDLAHFTERLPGQAITLVVGESDKYVSREMVEGERERLAAAGIIVDVRRFDGGHAINRHALRDLAGDALG
jgi:predicted esterase